MNVSFLKKALFLVLSAGISLFATPVADFVGSFEAREDGLSPSRGWSLGINGDIAKATATVDSVTGTAKDGTNFYRVTVTEVSEENWHVQVKDPTWVAKPDHIYLMSFWLRADAARDAQLSVYGNQTDKNKYRTSSSIKVETEWKEYKQVFISDAEGPGKINFAVVLGFEPGVYDIDGVTLDEQPANGTMYANGSFEADGAGWSLFVNTDSGSTAGATMSIETTGAYEGEKFCRITTDSVTEENSWHVQLQDGSINVDSGVTYSLVFWAKADAEKSIEIVAQGGEASGYEYLEGSSTLLTTEWAEYAFSYTSLTTGPDSLNFFLYCGVEAGAFDFDAVVLTNDKVGVTTSAPSIVKGTGALLGVQLYPKTLQCSFSRSSAAPVTFTMFTIKGSLFSSQVVKGETFSLPRPPSGTWVIHGGGISRKVIVP